MQAWIARFHQLAPRERGLVSIAALLIALAVLWWIGIAPALSKIKAAQTAAPQLDAQLQLMRAQAAEAATLKAQRVLSYDESLRALDLSLKTFGSSATLAVSDSRATLTLRAASGDTLAQWLAQVRANARLVPSELRIQRSANSAAPGNGAITWDGQIILALPSR
jgi:general secretion pathway protein M